MESLFNKSSFNITIHELTQLNKEHEIIVWVTNEDFNWANIICSYQLSWHRNYRIIHGWAFDPNPTEIIRCLRLTDRHNLFRIVTWYIRFSLFSFNREFLSAFYRCIFNFVHRFFLIRNIQEMWNENNRITSSTKNIQCIKKFSICTGKRTRVFSFLSRFNMLSISSHFYLQWIPVSLLIHVAISCGVCFFFRWTFSFKCTHCLL